MPPLLVNERPVSTNGLNTAKGLYGLDKATQLTLPTVRTLPDRYGQWIKWCEERISLVDGEAAQQAGITLHGSDTAMITFVTNKHA